MSATFSPWGYRTALMEHFATSSETPRTPSRHRRQQQQQQRRQQHSGSVVIENSRLYVGNDDSVAVGSPQRMNASSTVLRGAAAAASGVWGREPNPRSFVIDFIDQCVANHVPESVIVEHVLFMVHAMQEQLSLHEALHTRFHHDRLRQYEMSELTNMLRRQNVHYSQLQCDMEQSALQKQDAREKTTPCRSTRQCAGPLSCSNGPLNTNAESAAGVMAAKPTTRPIARLMRAPSDGRTARAAFTQTPWEANPVGQPTASGARGTLAPTFQRFMRPTDASNRKERRRHMHLCGEEERYRQQPAGGARMAQSRVLASKNEVAAWRGRQRIIDRNLTWSDGDDDNDEEGKEVGGVCGAEKREASSSLPGVRRATGRKPTGGMQQNKAALHGDSKGVASSTQEAPREGEEEANGRGALASVSGTRHTSPTTLGAAPPMSVRTPSFFPNPQLQAYIERSQRKVREAERVLANSPQHQGGGGGGGGDDSSSTRQVRQSSTSHSPLSGVLSELSES